MPEHEKPENDKPDVGDPIKFPDHDPGEVADNPNPQIIADAPTLVPADDADDDVDERPEPLPNPRAARMKAIADRLKAQRNPGAVEHNGDFTDPEQLYGQYGKPTDEPVAEPEARATPAAPASKKMKLVVDGDELEHDVAEIARLADMSPEEVAADPARAARYAQKEIAATRRLERAKGILDGAKDSRRAPGNPPHQADQRANEDPEYAPEPGDDPDQDHLAKVIEDVQFGADPKDAAAKLRSTINDLASTAATNASVQERMKADLNETLATYEQVKKDNPSLFADPHAEAVMERMLYDGYREDLKAIGVTEDRMPRDPAKLADMHRAARVNRHPVRAAKQLLGDVATRYTAWRSGTPGNPNPAPRSEGRVAVDRTMRRQAIPNQPTRSSSAPPQVPTAPVKKTRADTIAEMRKARGQVTAS